MAGIITSLFACTTTKNTTMWVNSLKSECSNGAGKTTCLSVYRGEKLEDAKWETFYSKIEGFNFEPGYLQKIKVQEEQLNKEEIPADVSSIKYTLIEVLNKEFDSKTLLNDIWTLVKINGGKINKMAKLPTLEINLSKMQVMGNNGCNSYTGKINKVNSSVIEFGPIASTKKMCLQMEIPDNFDKAISKVASYKIENSILTLFDKEGNEVLAFLKAD